jgi:hypothetical protein
MESAVYGGIEANDIGTEHGTVGLEPPVSACIDRLTSRARPVGPAIVRRMTTLPDSIGRMFSFR